MPAVTREFTVNRSIDAVWNLFDTPSELAPCVPGCESVESLSEDLFDVDVTVEVAYTRLTFDTTVEITDKEPSSTMTVVAEATPRGHIPGTATANGGLVLEAVDENSTAGEITIEFSIFGRLGSLGESAFRRKSEEITDQFVENVLEKLESSSAPPA